MERLTLGCEVQSEDSDSLWAVPDGEQKKEDHGDGSDKLINGLEDRRMKMS